MSKTELQRMYEQACNKTKRPPDPSEFRAWTNTLGMFVADEIQEALDSWWAGSHFLPTAKELLPTAISARNRRFARSNNGQQLVRWRCPLCCVTRCGFVGPQERTPRYCQGLSQHGMDEVCGGSLEEIYRGYLSDRKAA